MELLVILFGEFLFSLFGGLLLMVAEGVLLLFSSVFCLPVWRPKNKDSAPASADEDASIIQDPPAEKRKWLSGVRQVRRVLLLVVGVTLTAVVLINAFFFEPVLRKITDAVGRRTGVELTFSKASGNFFPGRMQLQHVVIRKEGGSGVCFDLFVEKIDTSFSLFALLGRTAEVKRLEIDGLSGTFIRKSSQKSDAASQPEANLKARRSFAIASFQLTRSEVVLVDEFREGELGSFPVAIASWAAAPLRSSFAVFDILFRSNAEGTAGGQSFSVQTQSVPGGRSTRWYTRNLPVTLLSSYVGPPFDLLQAGVVDVEVVDFWRIGRQTEIDMHWSLDFREVTAGVPSSLEPWAARLAKPVVEYINGQNETVSIGFDLTMNENEFRGAASLDAAGLWQAVSHAFVKEVSSRLDISGDELKSGISEGFSRFKNFLDEKRTNKDRQAE